MRTSAPGRRSRATDGYSPKAQTLRRRFQEADRIWLELDRVIAEHRLADRTQEALFDAYLGGRVTRAGYVDRTGLGPQTAGRDLNRLAGLGLLDVYGETRNRHYLAGPELTQLRQEVLARRAAIANPYPAMWDDLR